MICDVDFIVIFKEFNGSLQARLQYTRSYSLACVFPVIGNINQNSYINWRCSKYESETITLLCVIQKWPMQLLMSWQALKQKKMK